MRLNHLFWHIATSGLHLGNHRRIHLLHDAASAAEGKSKENRFLGLALHPQLGRHLRHPYGLLAAGQSYRHTMGPPVYHTFHTVPIQPGPRRKRQLRHP